MTTVIPVAQHLRLTAVALSDHGRAVKSEHVKRAGLRLAAGGDMAYQEEGQNLIRSAAADLRLADPAQRRYYELAAYVQRTADYLEIENDAIARRFASASIAELKAIRAAIEVER